MELSPLQSYLLTFLVSAVLFHGVLVWPRNLTKHQWKCVDYYWLVAALLSLIAFGGDVRTKQAEAAERMALVRAEAMKELFEGFYVDEPPAYFCRTFVQSSFSPDNFDQIEREYAAVCDWVLQFASEFRTATEPGLKQVSWEQFGPPAVKIEGLAQSLLDMQRQLSFYQQAVSELQTTREQKVPNTIEQIYFFLGPYILAIAIALRTAKTTGELRLEKKAKAKGQKDER